MISSSSSSSSTSSYPSSPPGDNERDAFFQLVASLRKSLLLTGSSVHRRHQLLKDCFQLNEMKGQTPVFLSPNMAALSFEKYGETLSEWFDLKLEFMKVPSLLEFVTRILHQDQVMGLKSSTQIQTVHTPRSSRFYLPTTMGYRKHQKSCIRRLKEDIQILVLVDISTWSLLWLDHLDVLCRIAREQDDPFGGMQVIMEGDFFRPGPMGEPSEVESKLKFIHHSKNWTSIASTVLYLQPSSNPQSVDSILETLVRKPAFDTTATSHDDVMIPISLFQSHFHNDISWEGGRHNSRPIHYLSVFLSKHEAMETNYIRVCQMKEYSPQSSEHFKPIWSYELRIDMEIQKKAREGTLCFGEKYAFPSMTTHQTDFGILMKDWLNETYVPRLGRHNCFFGALNMPVRIYTKTQKLESGAAIPWGCMGWVRFTNGKTCTIQLDNEDQDECSIQREVHYLDFKEYFKPNSITCEAFPFVPNYAVILYELQGWALSPNIHITFYAKPSVVIHLGNFYAMVQLVEQVSQICMIPFEGNYKGKDSSSFQDEQNEEEEENSFQQEDNQGSSRRKKWRSSRASFQAHELGLIYKDRICSVQHQLKESSLTTSNLQSYATTWRYTQHSKKGTSTSLLKPIPTRTVPTFSSSSLSPSVSTFTNFAERKQQEREEERTRKAQEEKDKEEARASASSRSMLSKLSFQTFELRKMCGTMFHK